MPKLTRKGVFKILQKLYEANAVSIKYDLIASADVIIQSLHIGYTEMQLKKDQDPADKNHFVSKTDYDAVYREEGLRVTVLAGGMTGGFWELKISVKAANDPTFKNLVSYPITCKTDASGHLDIAQFFKY